MQRCYKFLPGITSWFLLILYFGISSLPVSAQFDDSLFSDFFEEGEENETIFEETPHKNSIKRNEAQ